MENKLPEAIKIADVAMSEFLTKLDLPGDLLEHLNDIPIKVADYSNPVHVILLDGNDWAYGRGVHEIYVCPDFLEDLQEKYDRDTIERKPIYVRAMARDIIHERLHGNSQTLIEGKDESFLINAMGIKDNECGHGLEEGIVHVLSRVIVNSQGKAVLDLDAEVDAIKLSEDQDKYAAKLIKERGKDFIEWYLISAYQEIYQNPIEKDMGREKFLSEIEKTDEMYEVGKD
ncbi:MAG: hypothetical protein FWE31_02965 [Firmicutes bacterium]|nr:hypothetical protein [Bacillota bacterium]